MEVDWKIYKERFISLTYNEQKSIDSLGRLVFSFEDKEIRDKFAKFWEDVSKMLKLHSEAFEKISNGEPINADVAKLYELNVSAGDFHRVLRERLVSLRD